jgi:hypothetical protein
MPADLLARHHPSAPRGQEDEDPEPPGLQLHAPAGPAELAGVEVEVELEAIEPEAVLHGADSLTEPRKCREAPAFPADF